MLPQGLRAFAADSFLRMAKKRLSLLQNNPDNE
jgi:hypothetical protein